MHVSRAAEMTLRSFRTSAAGASYSRGALDFERDFPNRPAAQASCTDPCRVGQVRPLSRRAGSARTSATTTIVLMGVSGVGKSVVASAVAARLGWSLADGDDFHTDDNVAKMKTGIPLTDSDRLPWLARIATWIDAREERVQDAVVSCSALKRSYRDYLRESRDSVVFAHLDAPRDVLEMRLLERTGHFMPAGLLQTQLDALEPLASVERGVVIRCDRSVGEVAQDVIHELLGEG